MTSSLEALVNKRPHWPTSFCETLWRLSCISSSGVRPRASAITLFFPRKNLEKYFILLHTLPGKTKSWEGKITDQRKLNIIINNNNLDKTHLLFDQSTRMSCNFSVFMCIDENTNTRAYLSMHFLISSTRFCLNCNPFFCVRVRETEKLKKKI